MHCNTSTRVLALGCRCAFSALHEPRFRADAQPGQADALGELVNQLDVGAKRTKMDDAVDTFNSTFLRAASKNWRADVESAGRSKGGANDMSW